MSPILETINNGVFFYLGQFDERQRNCLVRGAVVIVVLVSVATFSRHSTFLMRF